MLGAHYDHFGSYADLLFPGADDNASGTAVLLEIARILASSDNRPKRSILLVAFSGEERGLLGSRFYVGHPDRPLAMIKAMVNVDHAGVGNGKITVGLSKLEKSVAQSAGDKIGLGEKLELFGLFPGGDHVPFAEAGIPTATIVSSGPHPDFHQTTDTPDKINQEILTSIARYTLSLLWTLANMEFRVEFVCKDAMNFRAWSRLSSRFAPKTSTWNFLNPSTNFSISASDLNLLQG